MARTFLYALLVAGAFANIASTTAAQVSSQNSEAQGSDTARPTEVTAEGFVFRVNACRKIGDRVTCDVLITSTAVDQVLSIRNKQYKGTLGGTRLIDNIGSIHDDAKGKFGSKDLGYATTLLVAGVPIKGTLSFDGIAPEATEIRLLELDCYRRNDEGEQYFTAQLRNVSLMIENALGSTPKAGAGKNPMTSTREVTFEIISCRRSLDAVTCRMKITNERPVSRVVTLHVRCYEARARMVDQLGNDYVSSAGTLAIQKALPGGGCRVAQELDHKATAEGSVTFENVQRGATSASLIRLLVSSSDERESFYVDFRNIPIADK